MRHLIPRRLAALILIVSLALAAPPPARASDSYTHILLIGLDRRDGLAGSRADAIVLCSLNPGKNQVLLTSFLRDLYLPIPGRGSDRLNAAYAYGGRKLLVKTLESNFAIPIDGCIEVDFSGFPSVIDTLGGVSLELREDEARRINRSCPGSGLTAGPQTLTGSQALCYARIRDLDSDGDFSRTRRQQALLRSVLQSWKDATLPELVDLVQTLLPMFTTDLDPARLLHLVFSTAPRLSTMDTRSLQIPTGETCRDGTIRGMNVLIPVPGANQALLNRALYGQ